ncbi:MAG: lipoate--protein ligase family protein [Levilactobacillus sp.]|jgi:lipoate-protein ligase A|uniref:Lipoate--protein ligase family protein n=1 Tax=Levilactobacillus suantsaiihabitans TaxID=2487722 RepID=A0A4Z0JA00_9LACO|nr:MULTISPECIES: lipoate--protein ligase family protein [Levilactobacillus]MCH4124210.1 lipoate--protein ligase family protein [Levilactobacillus sp.]MCI1554505.1 lipoate--protein ligase family protein [Levilactobacillus sp.]MCI1598346.1 lipoate--protein ligase family protein [Levilactobacillus sp.]MCI1606428.1 lipoate--protein ligase family protein [Levilactobacillus sp.]TGD18241.1 lipoate--protein ligase family protein [Levilactobacillus suantsaiihabitans]
MFPFDLPTNQIQTVTTPIPADQKNQAFGYTNALLDLVVDLQEPILHFWTMQPTVIMGLKDKRLPHLTAAVKAVSRHGYDYVLRNSGGLAVVSDAGVLNVSLFTPLTTPPISVEAAYAQMTTLVDAAWPELTLKHYEITRSYCPGDYDLSVDGQKIAGIAQRRSPHALVTMLYLSVSGDQLARGEMIRDFYQAGLGDAENQWNFPDVDPHVMTTTAALLHTDMTVTDAQNRFIDAAQTAGLQVGHEKLATLMATPKFTAALDHATAQMARRQPRLQD